MARPRCNRRVGCLPDWNYFKPRGVPSYLLEEVVLTVDEFEAVRLADLEGLYHEQAAAKMSVSRQTFGRIIESARRKIAEAIVNGKALKIEGGDVHVSDAQDLRCPFCRNALNELPDGAPQQCPKCRRRFGCKHDNHDLEEEK